MKGLFRTKNLTEILETAERTEHRLKRTLGWFELTLLGIGAIIGAGIFAIIGTAAAGGEGRLGAGPAIMLAFVFTAIACGLSALCYAEFTSVVPISGSAYTYSYFTLGELIAWIIGWDLILEYAVGNIAVAVAWSGYLQKLLSGFGIQIPWWLCPDYSVPQLAEQMLKSAPHIWGIPIAVNLPAIFIVFVVTAVLVIGIRESSIFNTVMVIIKLIVIVFFIIVGAFYVKPANWTPFAPHGWGPIMTAAGIVFFAYIGFDAISTAAEETRNPQRNLPIAMIASLAVCTVLYIAVAAVLVGIIPYEKLLGKNEPLAEAFAYLNVHWAAGIVSFGAVVATTAVLLVFQLGQPRIFFSMSRDGLLPPFFARVHPRFRTPHIPTILSGIFVAFFAAFMNIAEAANLCNIGTLFAFVLVCGGVIVLRRRDPGLHRPFRTPFVPLVPILGILTCLYLMVSLPWSTWIRFVVWLTIGLTLYFGYGRRHSKLHRQGGEQTQP